MFTGSGSEAAWSSPPWASSFRRLSFVLPEAGADGLGHDETSGFAKFDGNAYLALLACLVEKKRGLPDFIHEPMKSA